MNYLTNRAFDESMEFFAEGGEQEAEWLALWWCHVLARSETKASELLNDGVMERISAVENGLPRIVSVPEKTLVAALGGEEKEERASHALRCLATSNTEVGSILREVVSQGSVVDAINSMYL